MSFVEVSNPDVDVRITLLRQLPIMCLGGLANIGRRSRCLRKVRDGRLGGSVRVRCRMDDNVRDAVEMRLLMPGKKR